MQKLKGHFLAPVTPKTIDEFNFYPSKTRGGFFIFIFKVLKKLILWSLLGICVAVVTLLLILSPYLDNLRALYRFSMNGKDYLELAQNQLMEQNFEAAIYNLEEAKFNLDKANVIIDDLKTKPLFKHDFIRDQLLIAQDLIIISRNLSDSLVKVAVFAKDLLAITNRDDINFSHLDESMKKNILARLSNLSPVLEKQIDEINDVKLSWQHLTTKKSAILWSPIIKKFDNKLPQVLKYFDYLIFAAKVFPSLAGYPEQKIYLFLLQNNKELRPGGGFIGTYGILKIRNAEIISFFTDNIYNLDWPSEAWVKVPSPKPFKDYMNLPWWFMRDANWSPDFPTSALKVEEFYKLEARPPEKLDGIIAINPDFVEDLLGLVGPIEVDGITFTRENFFRELEYQVEYDYYKKGVPEADRKKIIGDLSKVLQERLFSLPLSRWEELFMIIEKNLEEKHILLYMNDNRLQQELQSKNWTGHVKVAPEDYLMLVDANLGGLKSDAVLNKSINYRLRQQADKFIASVEAIYEHTGFYDEFTSKYRSYTRLYVPRGSKLIGMKIGDEDIDLDKVDIYDELDKAAFGVFFEVLPQTTKSITFTYELPVRLTERLIDGDYKLLVQKQAGMPELGLSLNLTFDKKIKPLGSASAIFTNNVKYSTKIKKDEMFLLVFE